MNHSLSTANWIPANLSEYDLSSGVEATNLVKVTDPLRVAIAQITTDPGKIDENVDKIVDYIQKARQSGVDLVVFPELAIPGYLSMDLFKRRSYLEANIKGLERVREAAKDISVIVGFADYNPEIKGPDGRPLVYNSAAVITDQKLLAVQDKTLLPEYDIFFEKRYFAPPRERKVVEIKGRRVGTQICEDLWTDGYEQDPAKLLVQKGAELIVNISASPFHLGKMPVRWNLITETAKNKGVPLIYANLVGGFDGHEGEVVFDGQSLIADASGRVTALAPGFAEGLLVTELGGSTEISCPEAELAEELHAALVLGLRDYFRRLGRGKDGSTKKAIIGLSGGIDSAVVAALAVAALGAENVIGVTMPSKYNSKETIGDAELLAKNLGIEFKVSPIENSVRSELESFKSDPQIAELPEDVTEENVQARIRMMRLMAYANKLNGIVLNTGNRTEIALNNCTIYGDMVGGVSVLGDVDKDRVYALARFINQVAGKDLIPRTTIERVATAELKPNQIDAQVMGDDPVRISPLVRAMVEKGLSVSEAAAQFSSQYSREFIRASFRKLDASEWKRRQLGPLIRVTQNTFGDGRRIPMGHGFEG